MNVEKIQYKGWNNSLRLHNDSVELIVLTDVGPRIIRYGYIGGENIFTELNETAGHKDENTWLIYGGHRLSHAPEAEPRSHLPDNQTVGFEKYPDFVRLTQPVEQESGIQKEMDVSLDPIGTRVKIIHRLHNRTLWPIELAPWALSVMNAGGRAIAPLPERLSHSQELQPTGILSLWGYTNMSDPRWYWGHEHIFLTHDPRLKTPQKAGLWVPAGWVAYQSANLLFVKQFKIFQGKKYPDNHVNVEFYTDQNILEVETLGPLEIIEPGKYAEHVETWSLHQGISPNLDEQAVRDIVSPIISQQQVFA